MLDICPQNSKIFREVIHEVLEGAFNFFDRTGSGLYYEEVLGTVFPLHKQDDEDYGIAFLKKLRNEITDKFNHEFSPLKEYVIYHILDWVLDVTDEPFSPSDIIKKSLEKKDTSNLHEEELKVLNSIKTLEDLKGICFEDLDFLQVAEMFEIFKKSPGTVSKVFHIDLDYYTDLLPDDILLEYNKIKDYLNSEENGTGVLEVTETVSTKDDFYEKVDDLVETFKHHIVHKKGHILINNEIGQYKEKHVQVIFDLVANLGLKNTGILITREVDTGRGSVDFYLSIGSDYRALIEIKLGSHERYKDGLTYQLPAYLLTEKIDYGYFVLVCYTHEIYEQAKPLYGEAQQLSLKYGKKIKFERIDASGTLKSASKIQDEKGMGFD
ncbi:hypothetical protein [Domibacillus robiginosus]|uniref:hypothetical protein n=1 Tax=Domibacillus robiginosus TaxID=1071054 RepID=UPI00067E3AB7|nr:hypothetical protein [Domibacillus robiginosus]